MANVRNSELFVVKGNPFIATMTQKCTSCGFEVLGQWCVNASPVTSNLDFWPLYHIGCINEAPAVPLPPKLPKLELDATAQEWDFSGWLHTVRLLQRYGREIGVEGAMPEYVHDITETQRREMFRTNILSAIVELTEALDEAPWKPWAKDTQGWDGQQLAQEIVDALHFIGNALMLGAPDTGGLVLSTMYRAKTMKNAQRWQDGYRGRADKCPGCRRDLNELPKGHIISECGK